MKKYNKKILDIVLKEIPKMKIFNQIYFEQIDKKKRKFYRIMRLRYEPIL